MNCLAYICLPIEAFIDVYAQVNIYTRISPALSAKST